MRDFTLELPEIYSAYCLWINGDLKKVMGNPDPRNYMPETSISAVTFQAQGEIELIFAVANETNYYSGMVYPPAFGAPEAVWAMLAWRLTGHAFICAAALLTGLLCLALGMRHGKTAASAVFFLLCLCVLGYTGYPILHMLKFHSNWVYTLEKLAQYAMLPLLCLLAGWYCGGHAWVRAAAFSIGTGACVLILVFPALSCAWDVGAMRLYSGILCFCKWAAAVYLIGLTAYAALHRKKYAKVLLTGFVFYGITLIADERTPLFEPVYTGWPVELGGLLLVFLIAGVLAADNLCSYRNGLLAQAQAVAAKNELQIQQEHAGMLASYIRQNGAFNHEAKKKLSLLRFYLEQGETEKLHLLLDQLCGEGDSIRLPACSLHPLVNSIFASKFSAAQDQGIHLDAVADIPASLPVEDTDLCSLLGNLLDNSIEACLRLPPAQEKWIRAEMRLAGAYLLIIISNPLPENSGPIVLTSKADHFAHGYGTQIINQIVENYHGVRKVDRQDGVITEHLALCIDTM